jgi:hypothetical protein
MNHPFIIDERFQQAADTFLTWDQLYTIAVEGGFCSICEYCLDPKDGVWKRSALQWMLEWFEDQEDYLKCAKIRDVMKDRYVAPPEEQLRLNQELKRRYHD